MNQWYKSSAVYRDDEKAEPNLARTEHERALYHTESIYPGFRVPHVWLGVPVKHRGPRAPMISTRDLAEHGRFTIRTSIGGKTIWESAADQTSRLIKRARRLVWRSRCTALAVIETVNTYSSADSIHARSERIVPFLSDQTGPLLGGVAPPGDALARGEKLLAISRRILGFEKFEGGSQFLGQWFYQRRAAETGDALIS